MDLGSGQIRQVTNGRSNNTEPSWFPDSQNLAFTSDQAGRPQVYKVNINGGTPQRITWEGSQNQDADVSADGKNYGNGKLGRRSAAHCQTRSGSGWCTGSVINVFR
ncbi:translocation protein TolB [Klebsiella grimontii]|uniref:Translocation protein TolB n=1 Tax=Klebsiella grimontii TaxID=2058152 RepID=A0A7H4P7L6_9ENTR|nr:translocation protein TolB [Klebsiella grimontii]